MTKFSMAGTLGDAFIVYCKLYNYWKKTGEKIGLYRYSHHVNFDKPIGEFYKNIPFVEYLTPCNYIEIPITKEDKLIAPYINSTWNSYGFGKHKNDPKGIKMEPFPDVFIEPNRKTDQRKFCIGIQLHSGKVKSNFKGLALRWLVALRRWLPLEEFDIYLFGTGAGYDMKRVAHFCKRHSIQNYVGKTDFLEWVSYIKAMNFFITPEGFSASFAMSQRVRSLVFFTNSGILCGVHPKWRRENIILSAGQETLVGRIINRICRDTIGRNRLLQPLKPAQVRSLVDDEIVYR